MDKVGDALTRIKNSYMAYKSKTTLMYSKLIEAICQVLQKEGYIEKYEVVNIKENSQIKEILVSLKYDSKKPVITGIKRVSKPGLRVYKGKSSLPYVLNGMGIALISTPKGIMTDKQARKEGLGGEVMALVW